MIPIWEHKYEISLDEPHFGHITDSEVCSELFFCEMQKELAKLVLV